MSKIKRVFAPEDRLSLLQEAEREGISAQQEFTHIATPEENAYIEAFHRILDRDLIQRIEFTSFYDAKKHLLQYLEWYNDKDRTKRLKMGWKK